MRMKKNKLSSFVYSWKVAPYVFVLPFIITFLVFWIYPFISSIIMSFEEILPGQVEWVGVKNYSKLLKDKTFHIAIKNSFLYTVITCALLIPFPMLFASILNSAFIRGKTTFKAILYIPALTSVVVAGMIFGFMFSELDGSTANQLLHAFGYPSIVNVKKLAPGDANMQTALATLFVIKYGSIIVMEDMKYAQALPLYGLRQNIFTDPQKPMKVEPGIYQINGGDENSICLTTVDFALTYFVVSGELERSGVPCNLIISDAGGLCCFLLLGFCVFF